MSDLQVSGIITSVMPIGEYDRRIVILTKETGRISAFVRGARRTNSPFLGTTREFIAANFRLWRGRDSYTVADIDVTEYFEPLMQDIEKTYYGFYFLEVMNTYTRENNNEREMLRHLYRTLSELARGEFPRPLLRAVFEFKTLVLQGEYPWLGNYADTKAPVEARSSYRFSITRNGLVEQGGEELSKTALHVMLHLIDRPPEETYAFRLNAAAEREFTAFANRYFKSRQEQTYKSLEALEWLRDMPKPVPKR